MDSTSMFRDRAPGAGSAASGLVALLAAAEALGAAGRAGDVDLGALPRQIVMAAFQAEAWGFTGSRRFAWDLAGGVSCANLVGEEDSPWGQELCLDPLYPSLSFQGLGQMEHVLAVDQVGLLSGNSTSGSSGGEGGGGTLWVHGTPAATDAHLAALTGLGPGLGGGFSAANATAGAVPPTPLTAFLRANASQSGFVVAGYDAEFIDPLYHTHWDTLNKVDTGAVSAAALLLARGAYMLAGGGEGEAASALIVNATLVAELLACVAGDWGCGLMRDYVEGELLNVGTYLGSSVAVEAPVQPSLYTGVLQHQSGQGLPTLKHTKGDGSWRLHAKYLDPFDPESDKVKLVPSSLEVFVRAFLSEQLGSGHAGGYGNQTCLSSASCPGAGDGGCEGLGYGSGPAMECIRGRCACAAGFYHTALDVGLERDEEVNQYTVLDAPADGAERGPSPMWTEPNWVAGAIGVSVYRDPGQFVGMAAFVVGAALTVGSGAGSWWLFRALAKQKLL